MTNQSKYTSGKNSTNITVDRNESLDLAKRLVTEMNLSKNAKFRECVSALGYAATDLSIAYKADDVTHVQAAERIADLLHNFIKEVVVRELQNATDHKEK